MYVCMCLSLNRYIAFGMDYYEYVFLDREERRAEKNTTRNVSKLLDNLHELVAEWSRYSTATAHKIHETLIEI